MNNLAPTIMTAPKQHLDMEDGLHRTPTTEKEGRSCCGCLCDMRRAVIILSIVGILGHALAVLANRFLLFDMAINDINDRTLDGFNDKDGDHDKRRLNVTFIIYSFVAFVGMLGYGCAIVGGIQFKSILVKINVGVMIGVFVTQNALLWQFRIAGEIEEFEYGVWNMIGPLVGLIMSTYVHISFVREVRRGIMTRENYHNEEQSCCCV